MFKRPFDISQPNLSKEWLAISNFFIDNYLSLTYNANYELDITNHLLTRRSESIMTLEDGIVRHCAPTLMGVKTGSLFNACHIDRTALCRETVDMRKMLLSLGMDIRLFFNARKPPLVYVYRKSDLARDLTQSDNQAFMRQYGYDNFTCKGALSHLAGRLRAYEVGGFPHEIGLFLSYPLSDVEAFVRFGSSCSKFHGYWCVFDHEEQAKKCFAAYDRCKAECIFRYRSGQPIASFARAM